MSIDLMMPTNHLILCYTLLLLPSIFPSIRDLSSESAFCIRWPKDWSLSFSISPASEYSGLISFRMAWVDLVHSKGLSRVFPSTTVWGHQFIYTQPSIHLHSAFYMFQLPHPYMTTGKTTAWTTQSFVSKVMSLLFNTLSRFISCQCRESIKVIFKFWKII